MIQMSNIHLMLNKLVPCSHPTFHYHSWRTAVLDIIGDSVYLLCANLFDLTRQTARVPSCDRTHARRVCACAAGFAAAYAVPLSARQDLGRQGAPTPERRRRQGILSQMADKLLFILIYQKTNPLQTMHGLPCELSQPQTHSWIHHLLPVLQHALATLGVAPERDASRVATSPLARPPMGSWTALSAVANVPPMPRSKRLYSGKKKTHTDKNLLLVNEHTTKVVYLGPTMAGKTHDKKAADAAQMCYPTNAALGKDTGFQGYEPAGVLTRQPKTERPGVERGGQVPQSSHLQRPCGCRKRDCWGETVPHRQRCLDDREGSLSRHGDCVRLAQSPRELSSSVPTFDVLSLLSSVKPDNVYCCIMVLRFPDSL